MVKPGVSHSFHPGGSLFSCGLRKVGHYALHFDQGWGCCQLMDCCRVPLGKLCKQKQTNNLIKQISNIINEYLLLHVLVVIL